MKQLSVNIPNGFGRHCTIQPERSQRTRDGGIERAGELRKDIVGVIIDGHRYVVPLAELVAASHQEDPALSEFYGLVCAAAHAMLGVPTPEEIERGEREAVKAEASARIKAHAGNHRALGDGEVRPFTGCVSGRNCDERAHGGVAYRQVCRCGASRTINANAGCREASEWQ